MKLDPYNRMVTTLPDEGVLLVCTDLQGNLADFDRMVDLYHAESARQPTVLAFCGDLVHGPSPEMVGAMWPPHLGTPYHDQSAELLLRFERLTAEASVFSLMGNHEHAHVGGPVVPKFYPDEAAVLDKRLGSDRDRICDMIRGFPLVAVAPCGLVLTHGSPRRTAATLEDYEALSWDGYENVRIADMIDIDPLGALLWARGCEDADALAFLRVTTGRAEGVVVHGHDVVRSGYYKEGRHHMVVSTSFALLDEDKTYVRVDLGGHYASTDDLREGIEILPLCP